MMIHGGGHDEGAGPLDWYRFFAESPDAYKQSLAFGAPGKLQAENDLDVRFSA
jgi:hypothetical protein